MNKSYFFAFVCFVVFIACGGSNDCSDVNSALGIWQQQINPKWVIKVTKEDGSGCGTIKVANHQKNNTEEIFVVNVENGLPAFTVASGDPTFSVGVDMDGSNLALVTIFTSSKEEVSRMLYDKIE